MASGVPMLEQSIPKGQYPVESIQLWSSLWRTAANGKDPQWRISETECYDLTATPIPHPPFDTWVLGVRSETELGKKCVRSQ